MKEVFNQMRATIQNHDVKFDGENHLSLTEAIEQGFAFDFQFNEIIGYIGNKKDLVTPTSIATCMVVGIGKGAFEGANLNSVEIGGEVLAIHERAFANNPNLSSVKLPDTLISVKKGAFEGTNLTSIILPHSMLNLAEDEFYVGSPSAKEIHQEWKGEL